MDLKLKGKVAVIGGASRGIGRAIAEVFAEEGCRLVIAARGAQGLHSFAGELAARGVEVLPVVVDLFADGGPERLIAEAVQHFGSIDILVNNAGGSSGGTFVENDLAAFEQGFQRNFWPALRASKAALPELEKSQGVILHVSSIWGREAGGLISYNAAKAALISLTKAMGRELASKGVRVVSVAPGSVLHEGGSWERRQKADPQGIADFVKREIPFGRFGQAREIADVAVFLCSARASWVNGTCVVVDGGQSRAF
jgi:3-oxoacyl-[acyl-carrier protein] reductase